MLSLDNFSDLWNVLFTTVHDGDLCQNFQGVIFFVLVHEDVWRLLDKLDHDDCHNGQRYQHHVQKERHPVDFEKVDDSQGCSRETPSINKKSTMQSSQWPLLLVWKSRYKSPKAKCKKGWQSHRHQNLHIIGTRTAREWLWADLLERRLRSYKKKVQATPITVIVKEMIVEILLPLVSEMRFMTIRPAKDPMEKTDWMMSLAHSKSQYSPSSAVIVNWSTE